MKRSWIAAVAALALFTTSPALAQAGGIAVGADAPDAAVQTLKGEIVHLADFMAVRLTLAQERVVGSPAAGKQNYCNMTSDHAGYS